MRQTIRATAMTVVAATLLGPLLVAPSRAAAAQRWPDERRAGPFWFHADFPLQQQPDLLAQTAALQRDLIQLLGLGPCPEQVHLFLFARKATYQQYVRYYFPNVPYRRALFIKRQGPGMVFAYVSSDFDVDLRHETTHALLHASLRHLPLWLDEGLAEYFEVAPQDRANGSPHLAVMRRELFWGGVQPLSSLEQLDSVDEMGPNQYRRAWAWVHFMLHGPPEAHDELMHYLADSRRGAPPGRLSDRLRRRLPDLNYRFVQHFRRWGR